MLAIKDSLSCMGPGCAVVHWVLAFTGIYGGLVKTLRPLLPVSVRDRRLLCGERKGLLWSKAEWGLHSETIWVALINCPLDAFHLPRWAGRMLVLVPKAWMMRPHLARPLKPLGASARFSFYHWIFILRCPSLVETVQIDKILYIKFSSTPKPFEMRLSPSHSI